MAVIEAKSIEQEAQKELPEKLKQLEAAAQEYGQWYEARQLIAPTDAAAAERIFTAVAEEMDAGRTDNALFLTKEAMSATKILADKKKQVELASRAAQLYLQMGKNHEAKDALSFIELTLDNVFNTVGKNKTLAECISTDSSILPALASTISVLESLNNIVKVETWMQTLEATQLSFHSTISLFTQLSVHSPECAVRIINSICSEEKIEENASHFTDLIQNGVYGTAEMLAESIRSLLRNGYAQQADILLRSLLKSECTARFISLIPLFKNSGYDLTTYIAIMREKSTSTYFDGSQLLPLLNYLTTKNDFTTFFEFFPEYSASAQLIQVAASGLLRTYANANEAIAQLIKYENESNHETITKIAAALISTADASDRTITASGEQWLAHCTQQAADEKQSLEVAAQVYERTRSESDWRIIERSILEATNSEALGELIFACATNGKDHLIRRIAGCIQEKFEGERKNEAILRIISNLYVSSLTYDAKILDDLISNIAADATCLLTLYRNDRYIISIPSRYFINTSTHGQYSEIQIQMLEKILPECQRELNLLPSEKRAFAALQTCWMYLCIGRKELAADVFEEYAKTFLELSSEENAEQQALLVGVYISLGKYHEIADPTLLARTKSEVSDRTLKLLCENGEQEAALALFCNRFPKSNVGNQDIDYSAIYRAKLLIETFEQHGRVDLIEKLLDSLGTGELLNLVSDFLSAGIPRDQLIAAVSKDTSTDTNILELIYDYYSENEQLHEASEFLSESLIGTEFTPQVLRATFSSLIRRKCEKTYFELLSGIQKRTGLPILPSPHELIPVIEQERTRYTRQELTLLLQHAGYEAADTDLVLDSIFGTQVSPGAEILVTPSLLHERLADILSQEDLAKIAEKWDGVALSEIWEEGYPSLINAQAENFKLMLRLEEKRPGITNYLMKRFGIHCFSRIPEKLWLAMYDDRDSTKQWALVVLSRADHNGALTGHPFSKLFDQVKDTHTLVFCESASLQAVKSHLIRGFIAYGKNKNPDDAGCAFIIVDWHAYEDGGTLSNAGNGRVASSDVINCAYAVEIRQRYIQASPLPFISFGCSSGVKFVPTVGAHLSFSESSGPSEPTYVTDITAKYADNGTKIVSVIPTFGTGTTLTHPYPKKQK